MWGGNEPLIVFFFFWGGGFLDMTFFMGGFLFGCCGNMWKTCTVEAPFEGWKVHWDASLIGLR